MSIMSETEISAITLEKEKEEFSSDDTITITARFSLTGGLRDAFTEKIGQRHMMQTTIL